MFYCSVRGKPTAMHGSILPLLLLAGFCQALVNVASSRPYTVSPSGFHEVVFRSHNNQGYSHVPVQLQDSYQLTNDLIPIVFPPQLWYNETHAFNASVIIELESPAVVKEVLLMGPCCNMGIYTPVATYAFGSDSSAGPWSYLGESSGLVSGDDSETPATRYEMHFVTSHQNSAWRYIRLDVTGQGGRYMSIRLIQILA